MTVFTIDDSLDEPNDVQGVSVDLEHDASLADQTGLCNGDQQEDRMTEISANASLWNFNIKSDDPFVQFVIGVVFICVSLELVRAYVMSKGL